MRWPARAATPSASSGCVPSWRAAATTSSAWRSSRRCRLPRRRGHAARRAAPDDRAAGGAHPADHRRRALRLGNPPGPRRSRARCWPATPTPRTASACRRWAPRAACSATRCATRAARPRASRTWKRGGRAGEGARRGRPVDHRGAVLAGLPVQPGRRRPTGARDPARGLRPRVRRWGEANQYTLVERINLGDAEHEVGRLEVAEAHLGRPSTA
jgi:hypothetical protein